MSEDIAKANIPNTRTAPIIFSTFRVFTSNFLRLAISTIEILMCPPSNTGIGSRLMTPRLIEKKAEKDTEIQTILGKIKLCEERVAKAGGGFYEKRESLKEEKIRLSTELSSVEREISQLCIDILPFCLVPNQLKEISKKIKSDKKIFQQSFEKDILEENFQVILKEKYLRVQIEIVITQMN